MTKPIKKKLCQNGMCRRLTGKKRKYCNKCHREKCKERDPYKYFYQIQKDNAKRRGKPFKLTLEEFKQFCYETDILHGRGRTSTSLHIDCIKEELGYVAGNLQPLTNRENIQKEWERRRRKKVIVYDWQTREGRVIPFENNKVVEGVPF